MMASDEENHQEIAAAVVTKASWGGSFAYTSAAKPLWCNTSLVYTMLACWPQNLHFRVSQQPSVAAEGVWSNPVKVRRRFQNCCAQTKIQALRTIFLER
jgi:hypothetical protein